MTRTPKGRLKSRLSKLGLNHASVQQPPFPCNDLLLLSSREVVTLFDFSQKGASDRRRHRPYDRTSPWQRSLPRNDPLLFVIPSEARGSAVRHSCAPLLPAHNLHQASLNPHGNTNLPFVIPGFQEWSAEPQIPRLRSPGFPVELPGVDELHAAFLNESRTRTRRWRPVQEIRVHGPKKMGAALQLFFSRGQDQTIRCLILIAA